jgi:hypothetical protein
MFEVGADGAMPVDFVVARAARPGGAIEAAEDRLARRLFELASQFVHHFLNDSPRRLFRLAGQNIFEGEQLCDEMHVGLDGLQKLRFKEHLFQIETIERVLLHDLHN